ncbi:LysR substrate-binding domain-containing protein [Novosphingobium resinovorum]|nr:LysR substrate-binding domain-containing protein [Novosphingobium resinovorum]
MRLTHAGEVVIGHYRNQLADREALRAKLEELRSIRTGQVTAAIGEGFAGKSFTSLISQFAEANPQIRLEILTGSTQDILRMIVDDEAHFGLVFSTPNDMKIQVRSVIAQPLMEIMLAGPPTGRAGQRDDQGTGAGAPSAAARGLPHPSDPRRGGGQFEDLLAAGDHVQFDPRSAGHGALGHCPCRAATNLGVVGTDQRVMVSVPTADDTIEETTTSLALRSGRQLEGAPLLPLKRIEAQLRQWNKPAQRR